MVEAAWKSSGVTYAYDEFDEKATLKRYLQAQRDAIVWKAEGLSEYDARRPLVPTGTNLLGLIKHLAGVEIGYFGDTFGRPFPGTPKWATEETEPNADLWATPDESREYIINLYRDVQKHSDETIAARELADTGSVPWWPPERATVTLHHALVHMIAETARHAGQADIVRELIDGKAGARAGGANMPDEDADWWAAHRQRVEDAARQAAAR